MLILSSYAAYHYGMSRIFRETPNTLSFESDLHPVAFEWSSEDFGGYEEPHAAILIPVSVPGISSTLYMQFDTGSPDTFLVSGALDSLKERGVEYELFKKDDQSYIKDFKLNIAGNKVTLNSGWVRSQRGAINWDSPEAKNIIGSLGADFLDQKVCEIDFPAKEIRFHAGRSEELDGLGTYTPFRFKGRRIMLPTKINGFEAEVFYDSGCSAFGLLTSKYFYDRLTDANVQELAFGANRHGSSVPIHHKHSDLPIEFGETELSIQRISYAELYSFLQTTIGRLVPGGFLGNKCLVECNLILDTKSNEFLVVDPSTGT
ncbi:MAG: hypothetical protein ACE361_02845 [Aureliella sp.]